MIPLGPVVARSRVRAARTAAWAYLSEPERRAEWWPELQLEPHVGGAISERWSEDTGETSVSRDASGTVDVWVEGHAVGFRWREAGDERETAVLVTLRTQGEDTGITVTETGFDALPEAAARAAASQDGWQVLLRDLTTALETAVAEGRVAAPAPAAEPVEGEPEAESEPEAEPEAEGAADADADVELNDTIRVEPLTPEVAAQLAAEHDAQPAHAVDAEHDGSVDAAEADAVEVTDTDAVETAEGADTEAVEAADAPNVEAERADDEDQDEPTTAELDFDALIRGDQPDGPAR
ncbi:SRPBCC family protein [Leucobacter chromiireducens]|uniref:SRPBCC family protein n=1 Tax=Leucobacter chromiireducens TaxID=283877 RepID=UPI000F63D54F|nr:SRPBCC domain-containing protein [Leucobacter chromiireducens]